MASFCARAFAAASCLGLLAILLAGPAHTSLVTKNLLKNGDAEVGPAATDTKTAVAPRFWTTVGSFSEVAYGTPGLPGPQTSANIGGGKHFFAGGPSTTPASITQSIKIPGNWKKVVASGLAFAQLSAYLGGSATKPDAAVVVGGFKIGPVTPAQRGNVTGMLPVQAVRAVARTCTTLRVTISSPGGTGAYDDAYADNVAVRLLQ
jgi:hypothetical protein